MGEIQVKPKLKLTSILTASIVAAGISYAGAQQVPDKTIAIGSITDLSGPAALGMIPVQNGARMRFEEANAAGGVHGRTIDLIAEDGQYQVPLSVRAANKLVQRDKIFAMLLTGGTPPNLATMPILDKAGIPNLFPITAARSMVEPHHPNHFSLFVSYQDQAAGALKYFHEVEGITKACVQTVANDYGEEVIGGVKKAAEETGVTLSLIGQHKMTETDFAGTATAIKNSGCEVLVIGTTFKDTISLYATLRQLGWDKPVVGNMLSFHPLVAEASDGVTSGLYLVTPYVAANFADGDKFRADFLATYQKKYGDYPNTYAQLGYTAADLVVKALEIAGRDLTTEGFVKSLESISDYPDPFGGPSYSFSADKHAGGTGLALIQSKNKTWEVFKENLPF